MTEELVDTVWDLLLISGLQIKFLGVSLYLLWMYFKCIFAI